MTAGPGLQVDLHTRSVPVSDAGDPVRQVQVQVQVQVVTVVGEVDAATAPRLEATLARACTAGGADGRVVVDTATMTFCSARGLDVLHRGAELAAEHDALYALVGLSPTLTRLLHDLWPDPPRAYYPDCATAVTTLAQRTLRPGGKGSTPHACAFADAQQRTLADRALIDQAIGVLDQHTGLGAEYALAALRAHATRHGFVPTELANAIVQRRVDPPTALDTDTPQQPGHS